MAAIVCRPGRTAWRAHHVLKIILGFLRFAFHVILHILSNLNSKIDMKKWYIIKTLAILERQICQQSLPITMPAHVTSDTICSHPHLRFNRNTALLSRALMYLFQMHLHCRLSRSRSCTRQKHGSRGPPSELCCRGDTLLFAVKHQQGAPAHLRTIPLPHLQLKKQNILSVWYSKCSLRLKPRPATSSLIDNCRIL